MREEWYVVPARYAFKLREVVDPDPEPEAQDSAWSPGADDDDALLEGLQTAPLDGDDHTPPAPRHLPRTSHGHLKR